MIHTADLHHSTRDKPDGLLQPGPALDGSCAQMTIWSCATACCYSCNGRRNNSNKPSRPSSDIVALLIHGLQDSSCACAIICTYSPHHAACKQVTSLQRVCLTAQPPHACHNKQSTEPTITSVASSFQQHQRGTLPVQRHQSGRLPVQKHTVKGICSLLAK
jgi:hypothetical protein